MTKNGRASASVPNEKMSMMFGWPILLTARASSTNLRTRSGMEAQCGREHLDGDPLADHRMVTCIDGPHPALGDLAID